EIMPNGSLRFVDDFAVEIQGPFVVTQSQRQYEAAAQGYADLFDSPEPLEEAEYEQKADPNFDAAFKAEYGVTPIRMADFVELLAIKALDSGQTILKLPRSELVAIARSLSGVSSSEAASLVDGLSLFPRSRWDEAKPDG